MRLINLIIKKLLKIDDFISFLENYYIIVLV